MSEESKIFDNGFFKNTVMEVLGIEISEFSQERVVAAMPVTPRTHQPFGFLHGGVSLVVAETVASARCFFTSIKR